MKIINLIIFTLLIVNPIYATCPINSENTVCSLPSFREQVDPIYSPRAGISEFSSSPEARLKPLNRGDIAEQMKGFTPSDTYFNYNSSCQFGVCMQNRSTPLFQQPKQ